MLQSSNRGENEKLRAVHKRIKKNGGKTARVELPEVLPFACPFAAGFFFRKEGYHGENDR